MSSWKNSHFPTSSPGVGGNGFIGGVYGTGKSNTSNMYGQQQQPQELYCQQQQPQQSTASSNTVTIETNGPRAKCDQVVFEAIAKAAEIVVGSRCWIDPTNLQQQQQQNLYSINNSGNGTSSVASSSRFNLFVPEVQGVR
jgi:hypothetical protein